MRIKIADMKRGVQGVHPNEVVAVVQTVTGPEELLVFAPPGKHVNSIEVGHPVAVNGDNYLVELPSETSKGAWRVWVDKDTITDEVMEAAE
jgi:hypothetical protein